MLKYLTKLQFLLKSQTFLVYLLKHCIFYEIDKWLLMFFIV